jgi:hypothetical protein
MPQQSNIPITTDRGYVAEVLSMLPAVPPAARATTRISNEVADQLVKAITRNPDATAVRALDEISRMSPVPQITTYHGSPSLFREFDPSADPMGRKRNAYGYGAGYTTESKDVANLFKEKSSVWTGEEGYLYKGEIPDELLGGFLKWDEPIKNQTKEIRELAKRYDVEESDLGGDLVSKVGKTKEGTDVMLNSGITGIEYKKFGDEPSNYVVFRPEDFRIQEINDIPIEDYYARGLLEPEAAYRGSHTAPNATRYGATLDSLEGIMPADVYSSRGKSLYGLGNPKVDAEWFAAAYKAKGNPDAEVTIYRAVPKGVKDINSGDWVTTSKTYADMHGENTIGDEYEILSRKVKAKTLSSEGYPYEFGYNEQMF